DPEGDGLLAQKAGPCAAPARPVREGGRAGCASFDPSEPEPGVGGSGERHGGLVGREGLSVGDRAARKGVPGDGEGPGSRRNGDVGVVTTPGNTAPFRGGGGSRRR